MSRNKSCIKSCPDEDYPIEELLRDWGSQHTFIRGFINYYPSSYYVENPFIIDLENRWPFSPRRLPWEGGSQWF